MKKDRFQYIPVLVEIDEKYHEHLAWTSSKVSWTSGMDIIKSIIGTIHTRFGRDWRKTSCQ